MLSGWRSFSFLVMPVALRYDNVKDGACGPESQTILLVGLHTLPLDHIRALPELYNHINISHVILLSFNQHHHFRHNYLVLENKLALFNYKF
jgi:hypothetical protein